MKKLINWIIGKKPKYFIGFDLAKQDGDYSAEIRGHIVDGKLVIESTRVYR